MSSPENPDDGVEPRNLFPVLAAFGEERFTVREYRIDLDEGGVFLSTDTVQDPGTRGTLKFRYSRFSEPFQVEADVVHSIPPGEGRSAGIGLVFVELDEESTANLRRVVEGVRSGNVVEEIRRSIRDGKLNAENAIRHRPTDQKLMLALQAQPKEIEILIRDGQPSVLIRLLDGPRLQSHHVLMILRNRNLPTRVLSAIYKERTLLANDECRWLFCTHPASMLADVMRELPKLPAPRLQGLEQDATVRPQIRAKAREMAKRRNPFRR